MKFLPILLICGFIPQLADVVYRQPHDAGYFAQLLSNVATVATVMYAMGKWGRKQQEDRRERREAHEAELAAKQKLLDEIVTVHRQLAPPGKPNIIERVEVLETGISEIKEEIKEIRLIVHPHTKTPDPHPDDPVE